MFWKKRLKNWPWVVIGLVGVAAVILATANYGWVGAGGVLAGVMVIGLLIKLFDRPEWGAVLIAFLLPFERIGAFEVGGMTVRGSQMIGLIVIISWLLGFLVFKKGARARNPLIPLGLLFLGVSLISLIDAGNSTRGLIVFGFEFFVYVLMVVLVDLMKDEKILRKALVALLVSCAIVSIFGLYQFLGDVVGLPPELTGLREHYTSSVFGFPRIQSTASEPLYFANYLLIPMGLGLALVLFGKKEDFKGMGVLGGRVGLLIVMGVALLVFVLTLSRGGYVGLAVLGLVLGAVYVWRGSWWRALVIVVILAGVGWGAVQILKWSGRENYETFVEQATTFEEGAGVDERYSTYEMAWGMFWREPVLGVGVGNFGPEVSKAPHWEPNDGWLIVNNEYLELMAERGVVGLALWAMIILVLIVRSIKALIYGRDRFWRLAMVGFLAAFLGILAQYVTFSTLYVLHIWFLMAMMIAIQNFLLRGDNLRGKTKEEEDEDQEFEGFGSEGFGGDITASPHR